MADNPFLFVVLAGKGYKVDFRPLCERYGSEGLFQEITERIEAVAL